MGVIVPRLQRTRTTKTSYGFSYLTYRLQRDSAIVVCRCILRLDFDYLVKMANCGMMFTLSDNHNTEIMHNDGVPR